MIVEIDSVHIVSMEVEPFNLGDDLHNFVWTSIDAICKIGFDRNDASTDSSKHQPYTRHYCIL